MAKDKKPKTKTAKKTKAKSTKVEAGSPAGNQ